jgi:hypothetical protein
VRPGDAEQHGRIRGGLVTKTPLTQPNTVTFVAGTSTKEEAVAEAGLWVVWGIPTRGRERQALDLLKHSITDYLDELVGTGRIERFDTAILKPQSTELGGFILIQGTRDQLASLRSDQNFARWATQVQLVADKVGLVDAWVGDGLDEAFGLYEDALRKLGDTIPHQS